MRVKVQGRDPDTTYHAARRLLERSRELGYTVRGPRTWKKYRGDLVLPSIEPLEPQRVFHNVVICTCSVLVEDFDVDLADDLTRVDVGPQLRVAFEAAGAATG